jgi:hypothetical protein
MSGSSSLDMAALATSGVLTVEQLLKAMEASHKKTDHATKHLGHAAIGAAVAVGALELLRRDEAVGKGETKRFIAGGHHGHDKNHDNEVVVSPNVGRDYTPPGHNRRIAEEIIGAYSLGQEMLGHKKNHVAHAVAEILGAIAAAKNSQDHLAGME